MKRQQQLFTGSVRVCAVCACVLAGWVCVLGSQPGLPSVAAGAASSSPHSCFQQLCGVSHRAYISGKGVRVFVCA
jgi:hypothetical protein